MSCQVEQIADCGDISSLARALFIPEREDLNWLCQCCVSLSPCGSLLAVGYKTRLCILTSQWISATDSNSFLISWSGTLPSDITVILALSICPSQHSSQNGPDWFCIIVGFKNGHVGFYTNTGHLLLLEKLDDKPVMKISCHTGTYGTLPDDIHVLFQNCECIIPGSSLFQTLRNAKAQLAKVQAGIQDDYSIDSRNIGIRKWTFADQESINDATVVGLELKNSYDHLLAASTYGGYDIWYRSVPPVNTLVVTAGVKPYVGFHYALEGGTAPPLHDVARVVAHKIKSALPGWLGGGANTESTAGSEPAVRSEALSMRSGLYDAARHGASVAVSPDRRLAAVLDSYGRVAVLDLNRGHIIRLIKGCRDAQCAFVQIFEADDKKPQLSTIKDVKRAVFLIIYNSKKGLIDIRLMQRGNRVAVFTATKNGQLLYNTCGLVGAEKNYTTKKLNLPELQCVLIDPDGRLKKIHIPFFYALEGEHSQKSKDLQTIREFRDSIKKTSDFNEESCAELLKIASEIKTLDIKKHCLDLLVKKYNVPPRFIMLCLAMFWDTFSEDENKTSYLDTKHYFANIALVTLFYRHIHEEFTNDMQELSEKIHEFLQTGDIEMGATKPEDELSDNFHLLEDDNCILERLLSLAQEKDYKEQQHARVTFAEDCSSSYKDFVSCFLLTNTSKCITLKPDISAEKLNNLASIMFKCIFKMNNLNMLTYFIKECCVDPKEIIKLLIVHLMNMSIDDINIEFIEKCIMVLHYICSVTEEATKITYNEISPWWQSIRDVLAEMSCPLRSLIVAMTCKAVANIFESNSLEKEEDSDVWESVTSENAKWGILIGKLEDISILSIVLAFKETFVGKCLPKLPFTDYIINLKYIYTRGKGSVTELIAKWLCGMGIMPEAVVVNELIEIHTSRAELSENENDDDSSYLFVENNRIYVDENPRIFKWLSLLRRQFPLSTISDYIIANMCWEYAVAWQKDVQAIELLDAVGHCINNIFDIHIKLGLFSIIWSTYIKHSFEGSCRLVNKMGRLPKDSFCLQDIGSDNACLLKFLEITTRYLENFLKCSMVPNEDKRKIEYEKIWDESSPSLVEVAQGTRSVDKDILSLNYQISCTIYYQCYFNLKFSKPLDSLYDIDYQYVLEALTGHVGPREINMKTSDKVHNNRLKFLTKLIRAAVESVSTISEGGQPVYNTEECSRWLDNIAVLAELWSADADYLKRQQAVAFYHLGYDSLSEGVIREIVRAEHLLPPMIAISIQRLKRSLERAADQPEWIVSVPPQLYKRMQNTALDTSIPAHPCLETTATVLENIAQQMAKKQKLSVEDTQNVKLAEIIIETCRLLIRRNL